jgi:5-methylcytosine-specific restriction endonuclease McrA
MGENGRIDFRLKKNRLLRKELFIKSNFTCQACGWTPGFIENYDGKYAPIVWINHKTISLEVDHILPLSRGGKSVKRNLQPLCSICNNKKRAARCG